MPPSPWIRRPPRADGKLIDERNAPEYNIPWKPQYLHLSLWTQTGWGWWGGTFDPNHAEPFWSQFTQAQRVVCDLAAPRTLQTGELTAPCRPLAICGGGGAGGRFGCAITAHSHGPCVCVRACVRIMRSLHDGAARIIRRPP